jgi:hypothetical protein
MASADDYRELKARCEAQRARDIEQLERVWQHAGAKIVDRRDRQHRRKIARADGRPGVPTPIIIHRTVIAPPVPRFVVLNIKGGPRREPPAFFMI